MLVALTGAVVMLGLAAPPPLGEVLAHARDAAGAGRAGMRTAGGRGSFLGNQVGTTFRVSDDGRFAYEVDGPVPYAAGFDGREVWVRDIGGEVGPANLSDRAETLVLGLAVSGAAFREGGALKFEPPREGGAGAIVLAFSMDEGRMTGEVTLDASTWRATRWTLVRGGTEESIVLDGEVRDAGTLLPKRIIQSSAGKTTSVMEFAAMTAGATDDGAFAMPRAAPGDCTFDASAPAAAECKRAKTGHVLVRPLVNDRDVGWFIFDTGAGAMVLDKRATADLALLPIGQVPSMGVGGVVTANVTRPESIRVGPVTLVRPLAIELDLAFLDQHLGERIAGIAGYTLLARCTARVDLATPALALHDPDRFALPSDASWTEILIDRRTMVVPGLIESHPGRFTLDTGASGASVVVFPGAIARWDLLNDRPTQESKVGGVGGFIPARSGTLASLEFGGKRHEQVPAQFVGASQGAFANRYVDGNIGLRMLDGTDLILDYTHRRAAFVPRAAPPGR